MKKKKYENYNKILANEKFHTNFQTDEINRILVEFAKDLKILQTKTNWRIVQPIFKIDIQICMVLNFS